ncbi:hypothetical protein HOG48_00595 [Candidatus Peregrinibacteria bacterium]|jgi:hypothetical protein|nr:hypothetical protein [Candidatus Peregrinibacteria bacterium]
MNGGPLENTGFDPERDLDAGDTQVMLVHASADMSSGEYWARMAEGAGTIDRQVEALKSFLDSSRNRTYIYLKRAIYEVAESYETLSRSDIRGADFDRICGFVQNLSEILWGCTVAGGDIEAKKDQLRDMASAAEVINRRCGGSKKPITLERFPEGTVNRLRAAAAAKMAEKTPEEDHGEPEEGLLVFGEEEEATPIVEVTPNAEAKVATIIEAGRQADTNSESEVVSLEKYSKLNATRRELRRKLEGVTGFFKKAFGGRKELAAVEKKMAPTEQQLERTYAFRAENSRMAGLEKRRRDIRRELAELERPTVGGFLHRAFSKKRKRRIASLKSDLRNVNKYMDSF